MVCSVGCLVCGLMVEWLIGWRVLCWFFVLFVVGLLLYVWLVNGSIGWFVLLLIGCLLNWSWGCLLVCLGVCLVASWVGQLSIWLLYLFWVVAWLVGKLVNLPFVWFVDWMIVSSFARLGILWMGWWGDWLVVWVIDCSMCWFVVRVLVGLGVGLLFLFRGRLVEWSIGRRFDRLLCCVVCCLIACLVGCLIGWLVAGVTGQSLDWLIWFLV